jgi:uncharacterized membrane protein YvbJ
VYGRDSMYCKKCGMEVSKNDKFCPTCGFDLSKNDEIVEEKDPFEKIEAKENNLNKTDKVVYKVFSIISFVTAIVSLS